MLKRAALALVVVALVGAADASARIPSSPSYLDITGFECTYCGPKGNGFDVIGGVASPNIKCVRNRSVEVFAKTSLIATPKHLLDTARTSDHGVWIGTGGYPYQLDTLDKFIATMAPKKIGPKGHRRICEGDTASYHPDT